MAGESAEYKPFGGFRTHIEPGVSSYRFTDQEFDSATNLYYYDARNYDPTIGRFISADTVDPDYTGPQSLNRYAYTRNNPLAYVDPTGHWFWDALDIGSWFVSAWNFYNDMSWGNAGFLAWDTLAIAPIIPSSGVLKLGMEGLDAAAMGGGQKLLALGRNRLDDYTPLLKPFAEKIGAKRVLDLHTPKNMNLVQEITFRMNGADQIHFNLAEMGDLKAVYAEGLLFRPGNGIRTTSWEFSHVFDNPALRNKTFYHLPDGSVVSGQKFSF